MHLTVEERVQGGIKFLDRVDAGWRAKIDTELLNIGNPYGCVFGQLYGTFGKGLWANGMHLADVYPIGLYSETGDYPELTRAWKLALAA